MLRKNSPGRYTALLALVFVLTIATVSVAKSPAYVEQLLERAYFLASHGLAELAAGRFQDAVKAEQDNIEALLLTGVALQASGKEQQAMASWQEADRLGDASAPAFLGDAYLSRGNLEAAESAYKRALTRQPQAIRPTLGLVLVTERRGQVTNAISQLEPLVDTKDDRIPIPEAFYHLGRLYLQADKIADALAILKKGVLYNPSEAGIHVLLGKAYEAKGSTAESIHAYERALQLDAEETIAIEGLKRLKKP